MERLVQNRQMNTIMGRAVIGLVEHIAAVTALMGHEFSLRLCHRHAP
jgi:hypothetical protein